MGNSKSVVNKDSDFDYNLPLGGGHPYVKPRPLGKRVIPACIEQVNKFNDEVLPKIEAIILDKRNEYKEELEKIKDLVRSKTWYDSERNEKPNLPLPIKKQITDLIGDVSFKQIANLELLSGLVQKYKSEKENNDESKCLAFEELSKKLHKYNFFVKNQLYEGILANIMSENDTLVNYKAPREKSFFMKSKKSKRRSPKRSAKRKSQKRRSPKRSAKRKSQKRRSAKRSTKRKSLKRK